MKPTQEFKKEIDSFFKEKWKKHFSKKTPISKNYPFEVHDPFIVLEKTGGLENFYLVGDNWKNGKNKPITLLWGFNDWKLGFISDYLPEYRTAFFPRKSSELKCLLGLKDKPKEIFVWGYTESWFLRYFAKANSIKIIRVEDGFIRSAEMGALHTTPYSLAFDSSGLYYNPKEPSDIEKILNEFTYKSNKELIHKAKTCLDTIKSLKLSKYNTPELNDPLAHSTIKTKKRIAILGQVDNDASIRLGNPENWSAEQLIRLARYENPNDEIIYRPHPEVFKGYQKSKFKRKKIEKLAIISPPEQTLIDFLETVDHVYTITSLSGLEALIRGIKVTTVGAPFYAGWGLTDDRVKIERRTRKLTLIELFTAAYLIYPKYLANKNDPYLGLLSSCYKIKADQYISLHNKTQKALKEKSEDKNKIKNSEFWAKLIFNAGDDKETVLDSIKSIDYQSLFDHGGNDKFFQEIFSFSISGSLPNSQLINDFINRIRPYIDKRILNELLTNLAKHHPGDYITSQLAWLLSENNENPVALELLSNTAKNTYRKNLKGEENSYTNDEEDEATEENTDKECKIWLEVLENKIHNRDLQGASEIIRKLLLSNYSTLKTLQLSLLLSELKFEYSSSVKISKLIQSIDLFASNRNAISSELNSIKNLPNLDRNKLYSLYAKVISLKPDLIGGILLNINQHKELLDTDEAVSIVKGMLTLDNDISTRKAAAYLAIEEPEKAERIMEQLAKMENGEGIRIMYSQALSYNDKLPMAFDLINEAIKIKPTSANLREMLRLCVLDNNYSKSLEILELAAQNQIQLGDMHKRKAYFGNRLIKEAFETFTEIRLTKTVEKYFPDKYYRFKDESSEFDQFFLLSIFGPGDEIRFASIYKQIPKLIGSKKIKISCSPRLHRLFSSSFNDIDFIPVDRPRLTEKLDLENYQTVPGSDLVSVINDTAIGEINNADKILFVTDLLHRCLPNYEAFSGKPYLLADKEKTLEIKNKLPSDKLLIGLSWRSSLTTHSRNEHYLSIEELEPIFNIPDVTFVNLQYDDCQEELAWVEERYPGKLINIEDIDQYNDFDSVAALMANLTLIISPATTVVELAGALGCQTWLFSNSSEIDWRKKDAKGIDVWHNNTTIIEGEKLGDKQSLVESLCQNLRTFKNI